MIKQFIKSAFYVSILFQLFPISYASYTAHTAQVIHGTSPSLSPLIEEHIDDLNLFGLKSGDEEYFGDEEIKNISLSGYSPLKSQLSSILKQPNSDEFFDPDGDEFKILNLRNQHKVSITWYYTNINNELVEFTLNNEDTFCSLSTRGMYAPFKVKLSANLDLYSKYGVPNNKTYPNEENSTLPAKMYTILGPNDAFICFARPTLNPSSVSGSEKNQWNPEYGFLTQSISNPSENFPTTGFYGAKFDLLLSDKRMVSNYTWAIKQGSDLVTLTNHPNFITITFNTADAKDPGKAWQHVMGSDAGYTVIIEGRHKTTNKTIQYAFTITKWFDTWKQDTNEAGGLIALIAPLEEVVAACNAKSGHYHVSHSNEISNAPFDSGTGYTRYTREIGSLFSEWSDVVQSAYPGSFGPDLEKQKGVAMRRYYVWDINEKKYCDVHAHNSKYHCRSEHEEKNAVCASTPKQKNISYVLIRRPRMN
ncbi:hypothetical protein [Gilliamella sp. ESL0254]|nr:hypothetical protein [Gilliamella sp. ESL0254]NUF27293.1 hypothetical protein [Gilliamella sp. ESL0254]